MAIPCTRVLRHYSDLQCLQISMRKMPAAIYIPSTLLKCLVKCIYPALSVVQLSLPQSIRDQQGVHSSLISAQFLPHSEVSIVITFSSFRAFQFESYCVLHSVERPSVQSEWHSSIPSQWITVPWHHALLSQSHPLDLKAHLQSATLSENTSDRVNRIPAWQ